MLGVWTGMVRDWRAWVASAVVPAMVCGMPCGAKAQRLLDQYLSADLPGVAVDPGVTVRTRLRPDYDAPGIQYGEVTIRPDLLQTIGFDDNVLGQPTHRASLLSETVGRLRATYDDSLTTAFAAVSVDSNRYPEQNQQSYTNWTASLGGSHQFGRDTLSIAYEHLNLNQTVRDLDTPQLDNALPYQVDTVRLSYRSVFNRVFVQPTFAVSNYELTNGSVAGVPYIQTDRNRIVAEPGLTLGYELAPRRNAVLVLRDASAFYRNRQPGEVSRDFNDVSALAGVDFQEGIFRYRLLVGYESRTFQSSQRKVIQSPIAEATVVWNPTGLSTLTGQVTRHIQDSADETTVAFTETAFTLRGDYEVRRNVLVYALSQYFKDDYSGGQGSQELISFGAGATWSLNRNVSLTGSYEFDRRNSGNVANLGPINGQTIGPGYSEDRALITVHFGL